MRTWLSEAAIAVVAGAGGGRRCVGQAVVVGKQKIILVDIEIMIIFHNLNSHSNQPWITGLDDDYLFEVFLSVRRITLSGLGFLWFLF